MKRFDQIDLVGSIMIGLLISCIFIYKYVEGIKSPSSVSTEKSKIEYLGKKFNTGTKSYEDLGLDMGIGSDKVIPFHTIIQAENNFWEIEYYNGKYYRVMREDWEYNDDERECNDWEEEIGNGLDLIRYANTNKP